MVETLEFTGPLSPPVSCCVLPCLIARGRVRNANTVSGRIWLAKHYLQQSEGTSFLLFHWPWGSAFPLTSVCLPRLPQMLMSGKHASPGEPAFQYGVLNGVQQLSKTKYWIEINLLFLWEDAFGWGSWKRKSNQNIIETGEIGVSSRITVLQYNLNRVWTCC